VAAAARGKQRGKRCAGQHANLGVHWGLVKLLERLAGGERERAHEFKAATAMAGGGARDGARRGEGAAFIGALTLGDYE
jgi:hypothetical protein